MRLTPAILGLVLAARQEPTIAEVIEQEEARAAERSDYAALSAAAPERFAVDRDTAREVAFKLKKPELNSRLTHGYDQDVKARRAEDLGREMRAESRAQDVQRSYEKTAGDYDPRGPRLQGLSHCATKCLANHGTAKMCIRHCRKQFPEHSGA